MVKVLLVGESWVSISTHYKGFNHFVSGIYETGLHWFSKAMEQHKIELTHMPSHIAVNDFPFIVDKIKYDTLLEYAKNFDSQAVIKRLGFVLEILNINTHIIQELQQIKTASYVVLDTELPKTGKRISRWSIQQNLQSKI